MKNKKTIFDYIIWMALGVSLVWLCLEYKNLPDIIPTHFGIDGQPDGYGSKKTIFLMWFTALGMDPIMKLAKKIDPKSENYDKFIKFFDLFRVIMVFFMLGMGFMIVQSAKGVKMNINTIMFASLGVLFMIIGNFMPKVKHNYTTGIKTPWTLASENVWYKTHRLAGKIWTVCGALMVVLSIISAQKIVFPRFIGLVLVMTIYPMIYSYLEFKKEKESKDETDN